MIIVRMMGGLGNQMFQYAFAQELVTLYNEEVCFDLSSYKTDKQRTLAITNFNVFEIRDWEDILSFSDRSRITHDFNIYRVLQRIIRAIRRDDVKGKGLYNWYLKRGYYFNIDPYYYGVPLVQHVTKVAYGYFQGEPYFQHCIELIKNQFVVKDSLLPTGEEARLLEKISRTESICVHIRIGDYKQANNKRFDVITDDYFQRGIKYISERVSNPNFYVFTNDPEAVEKKYNLPNVVYVNGMADYQDFRLMCKCKHFIISNSTFSWWASYLADFEGKIVVVPKKWRNNQKSEPALMDSRDIAYVKL